ncbi:MAG: hypothetical protein AAFY71_18765 [Bacteroidota bacterium]
MKKVIGLLIGIMGTSFSLTAQDLQLATPEDYSHKFAFAPISMDTLRLGQSMDYPILLSGYQVMPEYARENPSGYSFLCRLELKAEDKLPVGLWVEVEDGKNLSLPTYPHTYFRLKLIRF